MDVSFRGRVVFVGNPTLAHSPRVRNYGVSEIIWFPVSSWAVVSVGECSRVFFIPFYVIRFDNHGLGGVYARARLTRFI